MAKNAQLRRFVTALALTVLAASGAADAHDLRHGQVHIGHAWTRSAAQGGAAEIYFPIVNRAAAADRLVGARTALAARVTLAETLADGRVAALAAVDLPSGRPVAMRPGRLHIRLDGLARSLVAGEEFPLTVLFENAAPADVTVIVETAPGH